MKRRAAVLTVLLAAVLAEPASATPVCTDGYMGGPSRDACGGRIFPEAANSLAYIQYTPNPQGFAEYQHGIEFLSKTYPRWVSLSSLREKYGKLAVSAGPDGIRSYEPGDSGDGRDIQIVKLTDHSVPDKGKQTLFFSLSVHGNERGGLEGGMRTAEDLAMAATDGGRIADGMDNYASTTGRKARFHSYEVKDLLREMVVYFVDLNPDGWAQGDFWNPPLPALYARGNAKGTDLNRQMPGKGYVNTARNPLQESEARYGVDLMHEVADAGVGGRMAYGADVHGELTSQAYMDIMYPAGQFDSVDHRRLMAIAERTKSVIDSTLFAGIVDEIEDVDGGNDAEGSLKPAIPTKPAHWATVWDTLGYTDTGFIGDYLATELGVTGMDYEIFFNHTVPEKAWTVALQENHINATRGIIKTAMAYAMTQEKEFNASNVVVDPKGRAGYVVNPDRVTSEDGSGTKPGPKKDGIGADGKPVRQLPYDVSNQQWFKDTDPLMPKPFLPIQAADVARDPVWLERVDTLVLTDFTAPAGDYDRTAYFRNIAAWVRRGGNLVLTDRGLHTLSEIGVLPKGTVKDIKVYQPYANLRDLDHPLLDGLRPNARQLVEAPILGYGIGNSASPMTIVDAAAFTKAGGRSVGTTGDGSGNTDDQTRTSIGEIGVGDGRVRIIGGALPTPTEALDHRFGLRDYAMTYTALFVMENAIRHDVAGLGIPVADARTKCVSRRRFEIRLAKGTRLRGTTVTVAGKRVRVRRSRGRVVATVDLRGTPGPSTSVVRITRRTVGGRRVVERRAYRICGKRKG